MTVLTGIVVSFPRNKGAPEESADDGVDNRRVAPRFIRFGFAGGDAAGRGAGRWWAPSGAAYA